MGHDLNMRETLRCAQSDRVKILAQRARLWVAPVRGFIAGTNKFKVTKVI